MDYYAVLGVAPTASTDEIAAAYHRLARTFHPDAHPAASAAERLQFQEAMSRINDAYSVLQHPDKRSEYDGNSEAGRRSDPKSKTHRPNATQCMMCGCEPVGTFSFAYQHGLIFRRERFGIGGNLCKHCAQSLGRSAQNRTLLAGWWGVTSFFANFACIYRNAKALNAARRLQVGQLNDPDAAGLLPLPMNPGRPVFARPGAWVAVFVIWVVAAVALSVANNNTNATPSPSGSVTTPSAQWATGGCVAYDSTGTQFRPVDCSEPHAGRIIAVVGSQAECPSTTQQYVQDYASSEVYCITDTTG